jgi:hypothetical protein
MRKRVLIGLCVAIGCWAMGATAASGDGGPGPGVMQGWDGIATNDVRYVAIPDSGRTMVEAVNRNGGRVTRFWTLKGNFGIPVVAFDGTTDGLSRDKRTLVLAGANTTPLLRKASSFVIFDVKRFRPLRTIRVRGDFSFDALSPDAKTLYLIEHVSSRDQTRYRVRAYDLQANRLLNRIVTDKRSWGTDMQGVPYSRATTSDRGWVYTLYGGNSSHPFIHALDARNVAAVCIDLPRSWQRLDVANMRLRWQAAGRLTVRHRSGGKALAIVDTRNFRVLSAAGNP